MFLFLISTRLNGADLPQGLTIPAGDRNVCGGDISHSYQELLVYRNQQPDLSASELINNKDLFEIVDADYSLGFSKDEIWVQFEVNNLSQISCDLWIVVTPAFHERINLYRKTSDSGDGNSGNEIKPVDRMRGLTGRYAIFPVKVDKEVTDEYLLSLRGSDPFILNIGVWSNGAFIEHVRFQDITRNLFMGFAALLVASCAIGARLLERKQLLFGAVGWMMIVFFQLARDQYFSVWTDLSPTSVRKLQVFFSAVFIACQMRFFLAFFRKELKNKLFRSILHYSSIFLLIGSFGLFPYLSFKLQVVILIFFLVVLLLISLYSTLHYGVVAKLIFAAYFAYVAGISVFALYVQGYLSISQGLVNMISPFLIASCSLLVTVAIYIRAIASNQETLELQKGLVSQLHHDQIRLNKAMEDAVFANESKSRFLATVSHDLRQPMYAINLYISTLLRQAEELKGAVHKETVFSNIEEGLRDLEGSAQYLNTMFESLLDLSRLDSGTLDAKISFVSIGALVSQLESDYFTQAKDANLRFSLRVPKDISNIEVQTDLILLERLLRNLLVNAIRYTQYGGVRLSLIVKRKRLFFRVVDTGPGIDRAFRQRVFDEFFQVPSQSHGTSLSPVRIDHPVRHAAKVRGIGLGLAISMRLAKKLDTLIALFSYVGSGSVFTFSQPMRYVLRSAGSTRIENVSAEAHTAGRYKGFLAVVIDDDYEIRKSTSKLLTEFLDFEVFTAEDGRQAVSQLGAVGRPPDLIISDYRLLVGDGISAVADLRDEFAIDIPAILITGDTSKEELQKFIESGLRVLYKPITGPQLIAAIDQLMLNISSSKS